MRRDMQSRSSSHAGAPLEFSHPNPLPAPTSQTELDSAQETLIKVPQEERRAPLPGTDGSQRRRDTERDVTESGTVHLESWDH